MDACIMKMSEGVPAPVTEDQEQLQNVVNGGKGNLRWKEKCEKTKRSMNGLQDHDIEFQAQTLLS